MTQLLGIVGYPLKHTLSPRFQQAALDYCGLDIRYEAWETRPEDLPRRVGELTEDMVLGFNVTVPHKEAVCPLLDALSEEAKRLGAVNTVVNLGGRLIGHNTDAEGFLRALTKDGGFSPHGKNVLLLGAGGSARAIALTLAAEGVSSVTIANRTLERARRLALLLADHGARASAIPLTEKEIAFAVNGAAAPDLIVHCTSMGMRYGPAEGESPMRSDLISSSALVFDLVYNPPETPLLKEAKKAGARVLGGLPMLIYQGAAAFKIWTDKEPPLDIMFRAARQGLEVA